MNNETIPKKTALQKAKERAEELAKPDVDAGEDEAVVPVDDGAEEAA